MNFYRRKNEKIKAIISPIDFLAILERDSWRVGKNLKQIYDESALTYDIYNELRELNPFGIFLLQRYSDNRNSFYIHMHEKENIRCSSAYFGYYPIE